MSAASKGALWFLAIALGLWLGVRSSLALYAAKEGEATLGQGMAAALAAREELARVVPALGREMELERVLLPPPAGAGPEWFERRRRVLTVGRLREYARPFYDALHARAPARTAERMRSGGVADWEGPYPWSGEPEVDLREAATPEDLQRSFFLAQVISEDGDGDGAPDLLEWAALGTLKYAISAEQDSDRDGLTDLTELGDELDPGRRDVDADGSTDKTELEAPPGSRNPFQQDHPAVGLRVWEP